MEWYVGALKRYATFSGRARRREYWFYTFINVVVALGLFVLGEVIAPNLGAILYAVYALATFVPSLAVWVRRLHDTGRSAWWMLIVIVPLVGAIVMLVLLLLDSHPTDNAYGPNPKYA